MHIYNLHCYISTWLRWRQHPKQKSAPCIYTTFIDISLHDYDDGNIQNRSLHHPYIQPSLIYLYMITMTATSKTEVCTIHIYNLHCYISTWLRWQQHPKQKSALCIYTTFIVIFLHDYDDGNIQNRSLHYALRASLRWRTNKSPLLVSYLFSIGDPRHPSPLCPLCLMHDHTSSHLFECKSLPTSLSSLDLWTNPDKVEPFLATWGERLLAAAWFGCWTLLAARWWSWVDNNNNNNGNIQNRSLHHAYIQPSLLSLYMIMMTVTSKTEVCTMHIYNLHCYISTWLRWRQHPKQKSAICIYTTFIVISLHDYDDSNIKNRSLHHPYIQPSLLSLYMTIMTATSKTQVCTMHIYNLHCYFFTWLRWRQHPKQKSAPCIYTTFIVISLHDYDDGNIQNRSLHHAYIQPSLLSLYMIIMTATSKTEVCTIHIYNLHCYLFTWLRWRQHPKC